MNPTILHVRVTASTDTTATLSVIGKAKEGLVKQGSARKAVDRFIAQLMMLTPVSDVSNSASSTPLSLP